MVAIADVYDAMTSNRTQKCHMPFDVVRALKELLPEIDPVI